MFSFRCFNGIKSGCSKKAVKRSYFPFPKISVLSCPSGDEPALLIVPDKHTRNWSKVEVQSSKLNPATQVFETKINSVRES